MYSEDKCMLTCKIICDRLILEKFVYEVDGVEEGGRTTVVGPRREVAIHTDLFVRRAPSMIMCL